jgi:hypothetical protein
MKHVNGISIVGFLALAVVGCGSVSHATAATGPFVYVADTKSNEVSEFSASGSDFGALKPLTPSTVPTGPFPYTIAVDPQGTSAYATPRPARSPSTRSTRSPGS